MAKATKKSKVHPTPDDEPSNAKPKRVKTCHQLPTTTYDKKNRWSNSKSSKKVQKITNKSKKTLPRIMKGKMLEQTTPPLKMAKSKEEELFGLRHHLMNEMSTRTGTEPENSSSESSSPSTSE